ncbi:MAG: PilZ domain-containing protein [Acidobacteriia bacterium]|nr:PilZ domain-containing protein [Terriglobia bacterium]
MAAPLRSLFKALTRRGRGQRVLMHAPLSYRRVGNGEWRRGKSENVSSSGILFQAEHPETVGTPVDIRFNEPLETGDEAGILESCRGEIVRALEVPGTDQILMLAAKLSQFQFKPRPAFDVRAAIGEDRGPLETRLRR